MLIGIKDNHCITCGEDLTKKGTVKMIAHLDGKDFWETHYKCLNCGSVIIEREKRERR